MVSIESQRKNTDRFNFFEKKKITNILVGKQLFSIFIKLYNSIGYSLLIGFFIRVKEP